MSLMKPYYYFCIGPKPKLCWNFVIHIKSIYGYLTARKKKKTGAGY